MSSFTQDQLRNLMLQLDSKNNGAGYYPELVIGICDKARVNSELDNVEVFAFLCIAEELFGIKAKKLLQSNKLAIAPSFQRYQDKYIQPIFPAQSAFATLLYNILNEYFVIHRTSHTNTLIPIANLWLKYFALKDMSLTAVLIETILPRLDAQQETEN